MKNSKVKKRNLGTIRHAAQQGESISQNDSCVLDQKDEVDDSERQDDVRRGGQLGEWHKEWLEDRMELEEGGGGGRWSVIDRHGGHKSGLNDWTGGVKDR